MRHRPYLETVIIIRRHYELGRPVRDAENAWWRGSSLPFAGVIERAALAEREDGTRHPHQRRVPASVLEQGRAALLQIGDRLEAAQSFHELHELVAEVFRSIRGLGELATYDAADRLRHRLGLESAHIIYLHAGTRVAARRLFGGRLPTGSAWGIDRRKIPTSLRDLSTHELEDVLCIYKEALFGDPAAVEQSLKSAGECGVAGERVGVC